MGSSFRDRLCVLAAEYEALLVENEQLRMQVGKEKFVEPVVEEVPTIPLVFDKPQVVSKKHLASEGWASLVPTVESPRSADRQPSGLPHAQLSKDVSNVSHFEAVAGEATVMSQLGLPDLGPVSLADRFTYFLENLAASSKGAYFYLLFFMTIILIALISCAWAFLTEETLEDGTPVDFYHRFWYVFQWAATGGVNTAITKASDMLLTTISIFMGLIVFAVFVGMIAEAFQSMVQGFNEGATTVTESHHTLIIGWSESTVRTICQLAYLRRAWKMQNEVWHRRFFPWRRIKPATPVAKGTIVVLCNTKTKQEMHDEIEAAFCEHKISRKRTCVGWDVVLRIGDPTNAQDLHRVGAHRAASILISDGVQAMNESVEDGNIENGNTLRTLLALRQIIFSHRNEVLWKDLRVIVQLSSPCKAIEAAKFTAPGGRECVLVQDLSLFVNALMFNSISQRGLAQLLIDLVGFDGEAIRLRRIKDFEDNGAHLIGKKFTDVALAWEDAIPVGIITDDYDGGDNTCLRPDYGFAPTSDRTLRGNDRIVFVSGGAVPTIATEPMTKASRASAVHAVPTDLRIVSHVLCCGWRPEFDDPARFAFRLKETAMACPVGSSIHFLCTIEDERFADLMASVKEISDEMSGGNGAWKWGNVLAISHTNGDASEYDVLENVVRMRIFNKAILMSPMAAKQLSPLARDTRMLGIMLFLRHIQLSLGQPAMVILGENALDSTAPMALPPRNRDSPVIPDLINAQAIYAHVLSNALAFPRMSLAMAQLFSSQIGSPNFIFRQASECIPVNTELSFGEVIGYIHMSFTYDVCIGYRAANTAEFKIAPSLRSRRKYAALDEIVVITRGVISPNDEPPTEQTVLPIKIQQRDDPASSGIPNAVPDQALANID